MDFRLLGTLEVRDQGRVVEVRGPKQRGAERMVALYRSGRQGEALRSYAEDRRVLVDELGVEPGTDLRRLE